MSFTCAHLVGSLLYPDADTAFADYLMPGAAESPGFAIGHMTTPATSTRFGMKGIGESGAIATPAAIAATGAQFNETPLTLRRVRAAITGAEGTE